jgi:3-oxoacyl-[acyl-carrier protein] reductase
MKNYTVAVVTGGTGGLGREITVALVERGYTVVVNYLRADEVAGSLRAAMGDRLMPVKADVGKFQEVLRMAEEVSRTWGEVTVLINNAGITRDSPLVRQREEDWDLVIDTNVKGAFNTIRAFAPLMKGGGHIVNISSYSGVKGKAGQAAYSASKAALLGLTRTAARELARDNIRVNALLPGYMAAGMGIGAAGALENATANSLMKTLSDPGEVARFIAHLVGTEKVTGQIFTLDSRII